LRLCPCGCGTKIGLFHRKVAKRGRALGEYLPLAIRTCQILELRGDPGLPQAIASTDEVWENTRRLLSYAHGEAEQMWKLVWNEPVPDFRLLIPSDQVIFHALTTLPKLFGPMCTMDPNWAAWWMRVRRTPTVLNGPLASARSPMEGRWPVEYRGIAGLGPDHVHYPVADGTTA